MSELSLSYLQNIPPQEASEPATNHLIVIHNTPQPVRTLEKYTGYQNEGWAKAGDINLIAPGELTYCRWDNPLTFLRLELSPVFVQQIASQTELANPSTLELIQKFRHQDSKILQVAHWLWDEKENGSPGGKLYSDSLTNVLAVHLLRNYAASVEHKNLSGGKLPPLHVSRAIEYMRANLDQDISLDELATVTSTSPTYLVRLFKNSTGFAPHQYLINLRVQRAKELMVRGNLGLSEIAALSGFADQSHLHRHFKRLLGVTPKTFLSASR